MIFPWKLVRRNAIFLLGLILLGLLVFAYHHRYGNYTSTAFRGRFARPKQAKSFTRSSPACFASYPKETKTDLNTHDLYAEVNGGAKSNHTVLPKLKSEKLKVFVTPMTHVDPGWLKTFDGYSVETNNILDNMLAFMPQNPQMRFIWCEMVFLERWFRALPEEKKGAVRKLVKTGQLELASGSWVMTDEANPFLPITVDNIVEGQQFVFKEFGVRPTTIWSNDPFGYSNAVPYLFTQTGIHRAVINRIHHGIKQALQGYRSIPFRWRQYFDPSPKSDVLTHVLPYSHYDVLNSCGPNSDVCCQFDFRRITDWHCAGEGAQEISESNVRSKSEALTGQLTQMSQMQQSNVVLMMLGDDFRYDGIREWHQQHDNFVKLFKHMNAEGKVEIRFGTFNDYFTALEDFNRERKVDPPTLSGDFFPYACALGDDWTGYFTTRPFYKRRERLLHAFIRSADLLSARATPSFDAKTLSEANELLTMARRNLSLFQHHDAITGTSKISVMRNYGLLLHNATIQSVAVLEASLTSISNAKFRAYEVPIAYNASQEKELLKVDGTHSVTLVVFNSLPRTNLEAVSVKVDSVDVKVTDENGEILKAQIEPFVEKGKGVSKDSFLLVFHVEVPRLGTKQIRLVHEKSPKSTIIADVERPERQNLAFPISTEFPREFNVKNVDWSSISLKTKQIRTTHSNRTGLLETISSSTVEQITLSQKMMLYTNSRGGPYLIRSSSDNSEEFVDLGFVFAVKGPLQQSVHVLSKFYSNHYVARDVEGPDGDALHLGMHVDIRAFQNTEAIVRFALGNKKKFQLFTDSIGLHMTKRDYFANLPVGKNYYPMSSSMFVQDDEKRITVVSNVEHGCSGQKDGFEIMLDRTMSVDDGKGLGYDDSLLTDLIPVDIDFSIIVEALKNKVPEHFAYNTVNANRALQTLMYRPMVFSSTEGIASALLSPSSHVESFPCEVQLLTVRPMTSGDEASEKLMILHRPGLECSAKTESCDEGALAEALLTYLEELKVTKVAKTNLNGLGLESAFESLDSAEFSVEPMDFAAYRLKH